MNQQDSGGREWRPYELATPIARPTDEAVAALPLGAGMPIGSQHLLPGMIDDGEIALATPGKRLFAASVDTVLWWLPSLFVFGAMMAAFGAAGRSGAHGYQVVAVALTAGYVPFAIACVLWVLLALANLVLLATSAQTIGKRLTGIRIVRSDGDDASFWRLLFVRGGVPFLLQAVLQTVSPLAALVFWLVDVSLVFSEGHRTLHDRIADTIVVDA